MRRPVMLSLLLPLPFAALPLVAVAFTHFNDTTEGSTYVLDAALEAPVLDSHRMAEGILPAPAVETTYGGPSVKHADCDWPGAGRTES